jgi:hypothetical protein
MFQGNSYTFSHLEKDAGNKAEAEKTRAKESNVMNIHPQVWRSFKSKNSPTSNKIIFALRFILGQVSNALSSKMNVA